MKSETSVFIIGYLVAMLTYCIVMVISIEKCQRENNLLCVGKAWHTETIIKNEEEL